MEHKSEAGVALAQFVDDVGVPDTLIFDGAGEQTGVDTDFQSAMRHYKVHQRLTEPHSPWQNRAEDCFHQEVEDSLETPQKDHPVFGSALGLWTGL